MRLQQLESKSHSVFGTDSCITAEMAMPGMVISFFRTGFSAGEGYTWGQKDGRKRMVPGGEGKGLCGKPVWPGGVMADGYGRPADPVFRHMETAGQPRLPERGIRIRGLRLRKSGRELFMTRVPPVLFIVPDQPPQLEIVCTCAAFHKRFLFLFIRRRPAPAIRNIPSMRNRCVPGPPVFGRAAPG